jgi:hypothetical protein
MYTVHDTKGQTKGKIKKENLNAIFLKEQIKEKITVKTLQRKKVQMLTVEESERGRRDMTMEIRRN